MGDPDDDDPVAHARTEVDALAVTAASRSTAGGIGIGSQLGRYVIVRKLGAGGMGAVYAASDPDLDRLVAIKVLHPEHADERATLVREGKAIARLRHPNAITVHDIGESDGVVFIAMEYVDGTTLRAWLAAVTRSESEILASFVAAGRGLAAAHAVGLVHRDFKPDNVLVGKDGRVVVTDFGLARESHRDGPTGAADPTSLVATQSISGTPGYMSPEQFRADPIDAHSDQFSFCVAVFEALNGKRPFHGATFAERRDAVLENKLEIPAKPASRRAHAALMRGLSHRPEARWPTLDELLDAISPRISKQRVVAIAMVATLGLVGGSIAIAMRAGSAGDPCVRGERRLADVWDTEQRARLEARFGANKRVDVGEIGRFVVGDLDAYAQQWSTQWNAACHAEDRETDPLLHAQRLTCLENAALDLRGIVDSLAVLDLTAFSEGFTGQFDHASLSDCTRTEVLRAQLPAPPPDRREEVAQLLLELHRLRMASRTVANVAAFAKDRAVLARFEPIAARLEALGSPAAASASRYLAYYLRGRARRDPKEMPAARAAVEVALRRAERTHDDPEVAEAHVLGAQLELISVDPDLAKAEADLAIAGSAVARAGHPARITNTLMAAEATVAMARGHFAHANALWRDALPAHTARVTYGSVRAGLFDDGYITGSVRSLARSGRRGEAIAMLREATANTSLLHTIVGATDQLRAAEQFDWLGDLDDARAAIRIVASISVDLNVSPSQTYELQMVATENAFRRRAADDAEAGLRELVRLAPATRPGVAMGDPWLLVATDAGQVGQLEVARAAISHTSDRSAEYYRSYLEIMFGELRATYDDSSPPGLMAHVVSAARRGSSVEAEKLRAALMAGFPASDPNVIATDGGILLELGRWNEARARLEQARSVPNAWSRNSDLVELEAWLGRARLETGDLIGARTALEHGLGIVDELEGHFHYLAPMIELALARLLWDSGEDRVRARVEAEYARAGYERMGPGRDKERVEAEAWLATHPATTPSP